MNDTEVVAFKSYFLVLFVLAAILMAYLAYKLGMFIVALKDTYICEEYCQRNCAGQ